jgi:hypothetical protein
MDKENGNWKRSTKGKVATERVQKMEGQGAKREKKKGRAAGGIITGVKLGIKEKRQEKGEEGCMEIKVHLGNKWWKIRTIYSKEMETTRRRVEDEMKEIREIVYSWEGTSMGE